MAQTKPSASQTHTLTHALTPRPNTTVHVQVKLQCEGSEVVMPEWLESLLVDKVKAVKLKISKYNYGCAMLLPQLCRTFPTWIGFVQNPFGGMVCAFVTVDFLLRSSLVCSVPHA